MNLLAKALAEAKSGEDAAALTTLLASWHQSPSPSVAHLIDLAGRRAPDALAKKLSEVVTARVDSSLERLSRVRSVDDPRVSRFALDQLAAPPFCAPSGEPFLRALVEIVHRRRDSRLRAELPRIRSALRARLTRKPISERLVKRLDAIAAGHPEAVTVESPLTAQLEALLTPPQTALRLLADVYARPGDDGPRHVYSDFLIAQGDPRGELIALQLARSREAPPSAREVALLEAHGRAWLGPLAMVLRFGKYYAKTRFERGFLAVADFIDTAEKKMSLVADDPSWATVERFDEYTHWPRSLLATAPLRALRDVGEVRHFETEALRAIAGREEPLPIEALTVCCDDVDWAVLRCAFPRLHTLRLVSRNVRFETLVALAALEVERVEVESYNGDTDLRAALQTHEQHLTKLVGLECRVASLSVRGPGSRRVKPVTARFARDPAGRLQRA